MYTVNPWATSLQDLERFTGDEGVVFRQLFLCLKSHARIVYGSKTYRCKFVVIRFKALLSHMTDVLIDKAISG